MQGSRFPERYETFHYGGILHRADTVTGSQQTSRNAMIEIFLIHTPF